MVSSLCPYYKGGMMAIITLRGMNYLLGQIKPVIRLCNYYASLVDKMKQEDEDLSSFTDHYKTALTSFFGRIESNDIKIIPHLGDIHSDGSNPSEIEAMKDKAKKLHELLR